MKRCALILAVLIVPSLALAQADSIQLGRARLHLGMSEADVVKAAGPDLTVEKADDRVPSWFSTIESHGVHAALVSVSVPRKEKARLTFEGGKLTQVSRLLGNFGACDAEGLLGAISTALNSLGDSSSANATMQTTSWFDSNKQARFVEFRAAEKVIRLVSQFGEIRLVESLGRDDTPDSRSAIR
ncbi:MAG: hypothetical protein ACHQQS_10625 [Thermoanaerobaculales bacterium]